MLTPGGPCRGLTGIILGHKFVRSDGTQVRHCLRCGMPSGGWMSPPPWRVGGTP